MADLALRLAALLAVFAALAHSAIGEGSVFPRARIEPARLALLFRAIWHCLSVAWVACAYLLLTFPKAAPAAAVVYASAAFGNALATRLRHFGWAVLLAVALLALVGSLYNP